MVFADILYGLLVLEGESNRHEERMVETTTQTLEAYTGLTRKTIRKELDRLLSLESPYRWREEEGSRPNSRLLVQPDYTRLYQTRHLYKPLPFVENRWGSVLARPLPGRKNGSRFPYAILNLLLRKPPGHLTGFAEIRQRIKKRGAHKPPDPVLVWESLTFLLDLGLVSGDKTAGFRTVPTGFAEDGLTRYQAVLESDDQTVNPWGWAAAEPADLVALVQEIATLGRFDPLRYGPEMLEDLATLRPETDLGYLRYAVKRHRKRPQTADRWPACWRLFQNNLARQRTQIRSPKVHLTFFPDHVHHHPLQLPRFQPARLRWGKLVIWVNDRRFAASGIGREESIEAQLWSGDEMVWRRQLTYEDSVVRHDCTAVLKSPDPPRLLFQARSPIRLKQFSLDIQLEAEVLEEKK